MEDVPMPKLRWLRKPSFGKEHLIPSILQTAERISETSCRSLSALGNPSALHFTDKNQRPLTASHALYDLVPE